MIEFSASPPAPDTPTFEGTLKFVRERREYAPGLVGALGNFAWCSLSPEEQDAVEARAAVALGDLASTGRERYIHLCDYVLAETMHEILLEDGCTDIQGAGPVGDA